MTNEELASRRAKQKKANRPVTRQGIAISLRHMQILGALKQIRTVTAYTKQEKVCSEAADFIIDALSAVNDLVMDLELEK